MLTVEKVSKSYGSVRALAEVSARFLPGEVHAVLGENGAGKSTLMHVLSGFARPDSGSVSIDGSQIPLGRPVECKRLGIAMIHQHFTLVPAFTVRENLALGRLDSLGHGLDLDRLSAPAMEQAQSLRWSVDPGATVLDLPVGSRQRVEILKTLAGSGGKTGPRILIFDEPTAVLSREEVDDLFRVLRTLKEQGKIVILIAHKLREVMEIADRVTVLRQGRVVAESGMEGVSAEQLARWMVGELPPELQKPVRLDYAEGLTVEDLSARGDRGEQAVRNVSFQVGKGEVLGIGGVDGNGQVELAEALAGVRTFQGEIHWAEGGSPRVAYIPQDRQHDGLALSMSLVENLLIAGQRRREFLWGPFLRRKAIEQWSQRLIERFQVKTASPLAPASSLSGGNQQKLVVARSLDETPDLLVAVNPSRGLDVKATEFVHRQILRAASGGAAVVLISTDIDELAALASRTLFLSGGRVASGIDAEAFLGGAT